MPRTLSLAAALALVGCSSKPADPPKPTASAAVPGAPAPAAGEAKDPAKAKALLATGAAALDVRTTDEFGIEHLDRAVNIPVGELGTRLAEVDKLLGGDKTKPLVVYCGSGHRAASAKQQLEAAGYTQVVNGGGLRDLR
jgi:phage shock protein E